MEAIAQKWEPSYADDAANAVPRMYVQDVQKVSPADIINDQKQKSNGGQETQALAEAGTPPALRATSPAGEARDGKGATVPAGEARDGKGVTSPAGEARDEKGVTSPAAEARDGKGATIHAAEGDAAIETEQKPADTAYQRLGKLGLDYKRPESSELNGIARLLDETAGEALKANYDSNAELPPAKYGSRFMSVYESARNGAMLDDALALRGEINREAATAAWEAGAAARTGAKGKTQALAETPGVHGEAGGKILRSTQNDSGANAQNDGTTNSYSIREDADGKYVEVDTDQHLFDGMSLAEMRTTARQYIREHFRGAFIGEGKARAYVNDRSAKEYAFPAKRRTSKGVISAKYRASTELDNLLSAGEWIEHREDDGRHAAATKGWDDYKTVFHIGGQWFEGVAHIMQTFDKPVFYDVTKLKQITNRSSGQQNNYSVASTTGDDITSAMRGLSSNSSNAPSAGGSISIPKNPENVKPTSSRSRKKPGLYRGYTEAAFNKLGDAERRKQAGAEMYALEALAKKTGRAIRVVDTIDTPKGKANAKYDPRTGEITIALDAAESAYLYVGMHELTHAIKHEHAGQWAAFEGFVSGALQKQGVDMDKMIQYQMDAFGYDHDAALEEVVCNSVPAVLQDETNLKKLLETDRTLYERVMDFLQRMMDDLRSIGDRLSKGKSWQQMNALKNDRAAMQVIYDRMMEALGKDGEGEAGTEKMSAKDVSTPDQSSTEKYKGKDLSADGNLYNYDFLIKLPNMSITTLADETDVMTGNAVDESKVIQKARENGELYGEKKGDAIYIKNDYTGHIIRQTNKAVRHGLGRHDYHSKLANARASAKIGELLKKAVPINALTNLASTASGTYAMAAYMASGNGKAEQIAILTIEQRSGDMVGLDVYDTLHSLSTRKRNAGDLTVQSKNSTRRSTISIADLLAIVNETHQSLLSEDALKHFGETRNPDGYYDGRAKYSLRETNETVQTQLDQLKAALNLTRGHKINSLEASKLADKVLAAANSTYDHDTLARQIAELYDYMERTEADEASMAEIDDEQTHLMAQVMEKSRTLDMEHEEAAKPVRDYLRKTAFRLTDAQQAEARHMAGSANEYRKALFGRARISAGAAMSLDQLWGELSDMAPQWFPADATEGDMPRLLVDANG